MKNQRAKVEFHICDIPNALTASRSLNTLRVMANHLTGHVHAHHVHTLDGLERIARASMTG